MARLTRMRFLPAILESKRAEVARLRSGRGEIRARMSEAPPVRDLAAALRRRPSGDLRVIAEVKFRSPAKGPLRPRGDPAWIAERYQAGGASAVSVLCDGPFFEGSYTDLELVRASVTLPVLCKEFVLDDVQVEAARAAGADSVLLIVRVLDDAALAGLADAIRALGMTPLIEVSGPSELDRSLAVEPAIVGVNSRDLESFEVDPRVFDEVLPRVPASVISVAMSGVSSRTDLAAVSRTRADAALVGEHLMRAPDPGEALRELLRV